MTKATPLRKLAILGNISTYDYHAIRSLQREYIDGNITLIESTWADQWKNNNPDMYNLPEQLKVIGTQENNWRGIWNTFSDTRLLIAEISLEGKKIFIDITSDNGNSFDGNRKDNRWKAKFQIKANHLKRFKSRIDYLFTQNAVRLYEKELSAQAKKRIEEIEKQLLK